MFLCASNGEPYKWLTVASACGCLLVGFQLKGQAAIVKSDPSSSSRAQPITNKRLLMIDVLPAVKIKWSHLSGL